MNRRFDPLTLAAPGVASIEPYQPGKPVEALERELGIRDAVKLASNENPRGPSTSVVDAIKSAATGVTRYPDGNGTVLKEALAAHLGVTPNQLTLGNGSNDVLDLVARAFATPGHEVIYSQHAFAVYPLATQAVGATGVEVPARHWGHDLEATLDAVTTATRIVFIANPNNPTGTWVGAETLGRFLGALPQSVIAVVDEAYLEYVTIDDFPDAMGLLRKHPNLVITRTFSKAYGLAGLRVGYGISDPAVADLMNRVRHPFNVSTVAQVAAIAALDDQAYVRESCAINRSELARLDGGLKNLGLDTIPSAGNFLTVDLRRPARPVYNDLLRHGVIVRPIANYGMPNHLRITVGLPAENDRCIEALRDCLADAA